MVRGDCCGRSRDSRRCRGRRRRRRRRCRRGRGCCRLRFLWRWPGPGSGSHSFTGRLLAFEPARIRVRILGGSRRRIARWHSRRGLGRWRWGRGGRRGRFPCGVDGLAPDAAADEHAAQEDHDRHDGGRHEEEHELLAAQLNLVKPVVGAFVHLCHGSALALGLSRAQHVQQVDRKREDDGGVLLRSDLGEGLQVAQRHGDRLLSDDDGSLAKFL